MSVVITIIITKMKYAYLIILTFLFACETKKPQSVEVEDSTKREPESIEAITLLGDTLFTNMNPSEALIQNLKDAQSMYENYPDSIESIIWLGRRTAYTGRYRESIEIYSEGIKKYPDESRLYRHRGHRYISIRQFDKAIEDLEKAGQLIEGTVNQIEPDGIPNDRGIPISTLHGNIWYHLGLAYYLKGDFENAIRIYQKRIDTHENDDNIVSGTHWHYMALRRLERMDEAQAILEDITPEMDIIENHVYHRLTLFYKGLLSEEELVNVEAGEPANDAILYGIANWHFYNGNPNKAKQYYDLLLENGNPLSFGYIAGEVDVSK